MVAHLMASGPNSKNNVLVGVQGWAVTSPETPLDLKDPKTIKLLAQHNPSLLLYHYRRAGDKKQAIQLIMKMRKTNYHIRIITEMVYTFIYFNDYDGALKYLQINELINRPVKYLMFLIQTDQIAYLNRGDEDALYSVVRQGLACKYHESFIRTLVSFHRKNCKTCYDGTSYGECLKEKLANLMDLFNDKYISSLTYSESKYLYKIMPNKDGKFIERMLRTNPHISFKYYKRYAKIFGIRKEEIRWILSGGCRDWALIIAFKRGWIDQSMEVPIEQRFTSKRPFILSGENWKYEGDKEKILFLVNEVFEDDPDEAAGKL